MTQLQTEQGMVRVPAGTWNVDPTHSSVAFEVKHMTIDTGNEDRDAHLRSPDFFVAVEARRVGLDDPRQGVMAPAAPRDPVDGVRPPMGVRPLGV